jgi:lipopolysaccharide export system permease protein
MIFRTAFLQELRATASIAFTVLLTILLTTTLIRMLGRAAEGRADGDLVLVLMLVATLSSLGLLLSLTVFLSILVVMARMWRDHEIVVWMNSGVGLFDFFRPILVFSFPFFFVVGLFSFIVTPWALQQSEALTQSFDTREESKRLAAGQFRESADGWRIFFIENTKQDSEDLGLVFSVLRDPNGAESVLIARSGRFLIDERSTQPWISLVDGSRVEISGEYLPVPILSLMTFDSQRFIVDAAPKPSQIPLSLHATPTQALLSADTSHSRGELAARIGAPLLCLFFSFLAVPLSFTNPRAGASFHLLLAFLLVMTANNLLAIVQSLISQNRLSFELGWWPLHLCLFLILALMTSWRSRPRRGLIDWLWFSWRRFSTRMTAGS